LIFVSKVDISFRAIGSIPAVGSSRRTTWLPATKEIATQSLRF